MSKLVRRTMIEDYQADLTTAEESSSSKDFNLDWLFCTPQGWFVCGVILFALFSYQERQSSPVIINNQAPPPIIINN